MPAITTPWAYTIKGRSVSDGINPALQETYPLRQYTRQYAGPIDVEPVYYPGQFVVLDELGAATTPWHGDLLAPAPAGKSLYHRFGVLRFNDHSPGPWQKKWDSGDPPVELKPGTYRLDYTDAGFTAPTVPAGAESYYSVTTHGTAWSQDHQYGCSIITAGTVMGVPVEKGDLDGTALTQGMEVYLVDAWRVTVDNTDVTNAYAVGRLWKPIKVHVESNLEMWAVRLYENALDPIPAPLTA